MYRSLNYRAAHTQYVQENRISGQVMVKAFIDTNALLELNSPHLSYDSDNPFRLCSGHEVGS